MPRTTIYVKTKILQSFIVPFSHTATKEDPTPFLLKFEAALCLIIEGHII